MKWYTAYLHRTEEILACGTAKQVAEALGIPKSDMEKPQI